MISKKISRATIALSVIIVFILLALTACESPAEEEAPPEEVPGLTVVIPVPRDAEWMPQSYINGVELAKEHIAGLELPAALTLRLDDDQGDPPKAMELAATYVEDPSLLCVIGHLSTPVTEAVAEYYQKNGVVLLIPTVSSESVEVGGTVFRGIPGDGQVGQLLCSRALSDGAERVVIYYGNSPGNFEMAAKLEQQARDAGLIITDRASAPPVDIELYELKKRWDAMGYDAVLSVGSLADAASLSTFMRSDGFQGIVYCGDLMAQEFPPPGVTMFSLMPGSQLTDVLASFYRDYIAEYEVEPDIWAMQAYWSVMLVADAVESGVNTPEGLAEYFTSQPEHYGIFGPVTFEANEVHGRFLFMRVGS